MDMSIGFGMINNSFSNLDLFFLFFAVFLTVQAFIVVMGLEAFSRMNKAKVTSYSEEQSVSPKRIKKLLDILDNSVSNETSLRFVALTSQLLQSFLASYLINKFFDFPWNAVLIALNILLLVLLTETIPRSLGFAYSDSVSLYLAGPLLRLRNFLPVDLLSKFFIKVTDILIPGDAIRYTSFDSTEELIALADAAVEDDVLDPEERDLIESIILFSETVVREVMVPRTDMKTFEMNYSVSRALEEATLAGFSRFPVIGENSDDVIGLVYVKDLISSEIEDQETTTIESLIRPARFIPETKSISDLLREMQKEQFHMAVAVDEYGGIAGLVTLEDLIEEIVGEIVDEYDTEEPIVERLVDGSLKVDARMAIDELNRLGSMNLPEGAWDTVGGLVFDVFGRVPSIGEVADVDGHQLIIERVQGRRISRVRVLKVDNEEVDEEAS